MKEKIVSIKKKADHMTAEAKQLQQVNQMMEQTLETNARVEHELKVALADEEAKLELMRQQSLELESTFENGLQAELLHQLEERKELLDTEIAQLDAKKREVMSGTNTWSCHQTQGDYSSARLADVDEELELQRDLALDWQTLSQFTTADVSPTH